MLRVHGALLSPNGVGVTHARVRQKSTSEGKIRVAQKVMGLIPTSDIELFEAVLVSK